MGSFSIWHWLILLAIVALLFGGRGKLSGIMGDAAKGIRAFREGLKGEEEQAKEKEEEPSKPLPKPAAKPAARASAPRTAKAGTTKAKTAAKPAAKPRAKTKA
ncbi:MAG TPA: twin-arginine translocase TatA/TatE family subunit [Phenylobacterium sp.]|nr:twin-arginine translocase TatA/TatE family subunit [Phenylobacterium sp.]HLZ77286.1 twin-arginine translocase TatA/TatE family subunit [Phenylobacterium sp.]